MYSCSTRRSGFTIVELLLVIAIMFIMAAVLLQGFVGYSQLQQQAQLTADIETALHTARQQSQTLTNNEAYGVAVTATSVAMFAQSATTSPLRTVTVPAYYTLTPQFADSSARVVFTRRTGQPSTLGDIHIYDTRRQATTTITILSSGLVE